MLTEEQKKLIEAEERFRHELRKKITVEVEEFAERIIAIKHSTEKEVEAGDSKIMEFLNSTFGTLLIASVLISGGAGLFQQIQHYYENKKTEREQLVKYNYEIESRLDHLQVELRRTKTVGDAKEALKKLYKAKYPLSPELENRGLGSMLLSVYSLLTGTNQEKTQEAITFVRQLEDLELLLASQTDTEAIDAADKEQMEKLILAIKGLHFTKTKP